MDLIDELIIHTNTNTNTNSLARSSQQKKRNVAVVSEQQRQELSRFIVEDYGSSGLEVSVEVPGLTARDLGLEIVQKEDGTNTILSVSSGKIPMNHRRQDSRAVVNSRFSQSFEINDDEIDMEGIRANISISGVLTIMLPRKKKKQNERKRNNGRPALS